MKGEWGDGRRSGPPERSLTRRYIAAEAVTSLRNFLYFSDSTTREFGNHARIHGREDAAGIGGRRAPTPQISLDNAAVEGRTSGWGEERAARSERGGVVINKTRTIYTSKGIERRLALPGKRAILAVLDGKCFFRYESGRTRAYSFEHENGCGFSEHLMDRVGFEFTFCC
ncbi:hypothetical protein EVAR_44754_1 [Eumeta japonica]|uniref:Uncharacterized protein n=1 Tax=Eumeta variegata TaxID=151549 RepID=A0A4C1XJ32_EUMVA|nr:hypothetical protein EVAR_44754_1 [Eumeta japonica]